MKLKTIALAAALALTNTFAMAQGSPSGPGATSGDPAASSASQSTNGRQNHLSNPSGSGTSPSGGRDDNPDHGFDAKFPGLKDRKQKN